MSFTPGPWVASHYLDTDEVGVVSMDNDIVVGLSSRITEDNARLIAAAPGLLEALKLLMTEVTASGNAIAKDFGWPKAVKAARAAIAKATGGAA